MDEESLFRGLVRNQFCPDIDYSELTFAFRTVFYKNVNSYCCCPCGIEHEFLEYVTDIGDINEETLTKVLCNIHAGQCPHVEEADQKYVVKTSINATHIAAAVGCTNVVRDFINSYRVNRGSLFQLTPFLIALLKHRCVIVQMLMETVPQIGYNLDSKLLVTKKLRGNQNEVVIEWMSTLGYAIHTKDHLLLKMLLSSDLCYHELYRAFEMTFKESLDGLQASLIRYLRRLNCEEKRMWIMCSLCAILYDKPQALQKILDTLFSRPRNNSLFIVSVFSSGNLVEISSALKRHECSDIMAKFGFTGYKNQAHIAGILILLYQTFTEHKEEILVALKENPENVNPINNTFLDNFLCGHQLRSHQLRSQLGLRKLEIMLELGINIDVEYWLIQFLSKKYSYGPAARKTLELLITENPDVEACSNVVQLGLELDMFWEIRQLTQDLTGSFITDAKKHTMFESSSGNEAYNFYGPVLIECGFRATTKDLENALEKALSLHPAEQEYIRHCLQHPRSLKLICRDALRRHYKGRHIHHYVKIANLPNSLKNFVLFPFDFRNRKANFR